MNQMSGELFIVATPIGNLDDITLRAIETLRKVDLIAAEDTRHSRQLLNHLGIDKPMLALHEHNERSRLSGIVAALQEGKMIALVSDAGTPLISDPGYPLVNAVIEAGFRVTPIPGVSSVITALSAAGLPTDQFCFRGFLAHKGKERESRLQEIVKAKGTQVLLESTHRLLQLVEQLVELAPDHQIVIAKELTKRFERFIRGTATQCLQVLEQEPELQKGEFVILIHATRDETENDLCQIDSMDLLARLVREMPVKQAARLVADISGRKKNELYQLALEMDRK